MALSVRCDMQDSSGTSAIDTSGNGNHMTCQNGLSFDLHKIDGPGGDFRRAIRLNGTSHYLVDTSLTNGPGGADGSVALMMWVRVMGQTGNDALASWTSSGASLTFDTLSIEHNGSNKFQARVETGIAVSSPSFVIGKWYHVVGNFITSADRRIVIDTVERGSDTTSRGLTAVDTIGIGAHPWATPSNYSQIDVAGFELHDASLTSQQINAHYRRAFTKRTIFFGSPC